MSAPCPFRRAAKRQAPPRAAFAVGTTTIWPRSAPPLLHYMGEPSWSTGKMDDLSQACQMNQSVHYGIPQEVVAAMNMSRPICIDVPSVSNNNTGLAHTCLVDWKPVTPLLAHVFDAKLKLYSLCAHYPDLVNYIHFGFPMGPMPTLTSTTIHKNHYKNQLKADIAEEYFREETNIGCMAGPMSITEAEITLCSKIYISPVGMVPKPNSKRKWRVIHDLSYAGNAEFSVNDLILGDWGARQTHFEIFAEWCVSCLFHRLSPSSSFLLCTLFSVFSFRPAICPLHVL
jgi:hypothetical protein